MENREIVDKNREAYNTKAESWEESLKTNFAHAYLEKPAMDSELPESLADQSVLVIGVGTGDELKEILKRNPSHITAIDISGELLKIAAQKFPSIDFKEMDMSHLDFSNDTFDFVYSSLAFHYAPDWDVLLRELYRVLKKSGVVLFSTHNPVYWAPKSKTGNTHTNERGVTLTEHTAIFPGDVHVTFYNHPDQESIKEALQYAGFSIQSFFTPQVIDAEVTDEEKEKYEKLKEKNAKDPWFLVIKVVKP